MSEHNDKAANRSAARVAMAGRASAGRIESQVMEYLRSGYSASETVQMMRLHHCTPVDLTRVERLAGYGYNKQGKG